MAKKLRKLTTRKKIIICICSAVAVAVSAIIAYLALAPDESSALAIAEVTVGDITETLELSGTVNSENRGTFDIIEGTYVEKINVRIGDQVKKGDVLATFDTSSISEVVTQKRSDYNQALSAYNKYVASAENSSSELAQITNQIATLEREIASLEEAVGEPEGNSQNSPEIQSLKDRFSEIFGDNRMASDLIDRMFSSVSDTAKLITTLQNIANGISVQIPSVISMLSVSEKEQALISAQLNLAELKVRQGVLKLQSGTSLESLYVAVLESAREELDDTLEAVEQLNDGWIAEHDGIVREINIAEGERYSAPQQSSTPISDIDITSILSSMSSDSTDFSAIIDQLFPGTPSGMVLEYYPLSATFTVSKKDIFKIALEQSVKITAASGEVFDGQISYISPIATDSSSINISSVLGSETSSGGIEGKVIIEHPNKNVIIGLDVDMSIKLESAENVLLIPVESIQYSEDGAYVFKYDSTQKCVLKTPVQTGLFDGAHYQIVSGCSAGDKIIKAPPQTLEDGQKVIVKG